MYAARGSYGPAALAAFRAGCCAAVTQQQATFNTTAGATCFRAGLAGTIGFELRVRPYGPSLPVDTRWLPFAAELAQPDANGTVVTRPAGRGAVRFARVERLAVEASFFPDVSALRPLLVLYLPQFELCFPVPRR